MALQRVPGRASRFPVRHNRRTHMPDTVEIPAPLTLHTETVLPEWIDHNRHLSVPYYVLALDNATGALLRYFGITPEYRARTGFTTFTGDFHIRYTREVLEGDSLRFTQQVVDFDEKRVHYFMEMIHAEQGYVAAEAEAITLHIDSAARKVAPFPPEVRARIGEVFEAHRHLPAPENLGRQIGIRRR